MKKLCYLLICLFLVSCGSDKTANISSDPSNDISGVTVTAQTIVDRMGQGKYKEGELIVKFKSGITAASSEAAHKAIGAAVVKRYAIVPNLERVKLPQGTSVKDAVMSYMANPAVEYAEPNYIAHKLAVIPNDTFFGNQWSLQNLGTYAGGTPGADISATDAWSVSTGNHNVIVAVLDTGIDYTHPDLVGNIWTNSRETSCTDGIDNDHNLKIDDCKGWNFVTCIEFDDEDCVTPGVENNDPFDDDGHGTHVAGTIGAVGFNNLGVTGVMMSVQLMPVKVLNAEGYGSFGDIEDGIDYAVTNGAKVINASLGGSEFQQSLYDVISAANTKGVLLVASAGNDGANNDLLPTYPASFNLPNIISVAATDQNDRMASFSNFGPLSVDVAAPGVYILSTVPTWWATYEGYGLLDFGDGTSMAAPHVSGLAGLLWGYYTHFTHPQVKATILRYVDSIPSLNGFIGTAGRINAYRAISSLQTPESASSRALSEQSIVVTWVDRATGETGYSVERKPAGGTYLQLTVLPANTTTFTDSGLVDGTKYYHRIKAVNTIPAESKAVEPSASTPLYAPRNLHPSATSKTNVLLEWTDFSETEDGFRVERQTGNGAFDEIATLGANVSSYNDFTVSSTIRYHYRVRAFNSLGYSPYSNQVSIKTGGSSGGGGGGGCSIGARQNTPTAAADFAVLLAPFAVIALLRRRRR
jgi:subtilisin family serine protease